MGSSSIKIKVVIIDESDQMASFINIFSQKQIDAIYYKSYDAFLQRQSLKDLSFIIIREKNHSKIESIDNSERSKTLENLQELGDYFGFIKCKKQLTLKEKLISYIKKYSLERLLLYIFVDDVLNVRIPDYEIAYITLVSDKIQTIKEHILKVPKRSEVTNVQFKRLIKDLYKRIMVTIIDRQYTKDGVESQGIKQWKSLLRSQKFSFEFRHSEEQFIKGLTSTYSEYIIVNNFEILVKIYKQKLSRDIESKIIFFGSKELLKARQISSQNCSNEQTMIWTINDDKKNIIKIMKRCTDKIANEQPIYSQNTIIFSNFQYNTNQKQLMIEQLKQKIRQKEGKKYKQSQQRQKQLEWIDNLQLRIVSNRQKLKNHFDKNVFSFLITLDLSVPQIQSLKRFIRKQKFEDRVYMYSVSEKDQQEDKKELKQNQELRLKYTHKIKAIVANAGFKIKFQITPIDTIFTYKAHLQEIRYFTSKMGLMNTNIQSLQIFQQKYLQKSRLLFINSYHLVCRVEDYENQLKQHLKNEQNSRRSYFSKLKIILYDQKEIIKEYYQKNSSNFDKGIIFMHFNINKIEDYLENVYVPKVAVSFFIKKALPNFLQASNRLEVQKNPQIMLNATIVSKNELLKQIFSDEDFKISAEYQILFKKFSSSNRNIEFQIQIFQSQYIRKYSILWRIGYQLIKGKTANEGCIATLKHDIQNCLFKCKTYDLIKISDQQFDYFYINRIEICKTYIQLQIACIYIFSLPHGFAEAIDQIFKKPILTVLTLKIFSTYVFLLLSSFCSFEDEVIDNKKLVVYVEEEKLAQKLESFTVGDVLFNTGFLLCGKDEDASENQKNNCLIFQFQSIPFLSNSRIKNYLYIERFSFYKESTEYLISPFSKFIVKSKSINTAGKYQLILTAVTDLPNIFTVNVFKVNDVQQQMLFEAILKETDKINESHNHQYISKTNSLYKKAEMIGLEEQKLQLVKSIKEGNSYKDFLIALKNNKYLSALKFLRKKQTSDKNTSQIQANYYKKMIGVQKALINFKLLEYDIGLNQLDKVINYLEKEKYADSSDWVLGKIKSFRKNLKELKINRKRILTATQKVKFWKIMPQYDQTTHQVKIKMFQEQEEWRTGYIHKKEVFYLQNKMKEEGAYLPYHPRTEFGLPHFYVSNQKSYEQIPFNQLFVDAKDQNAEELHYQYKQDTKEYVKIVNNKKRKSITASSFFKTKQKQSPIKISQAQKRQQVTPDLEIQKTKAKPFYKQQIPKEQQMQYTDHKFLDKIPQINHFQQKVCVQKTKTSYENQFSDFQIKMGVKQKVQWQAFYFDDKFIVTRKGKRFKGKMLKKL